MNGKEQEMSLATVQRVPCLKQLGVSVNPKCCRKEEVERVAIKLREKEPSLYDSLPLLEPQCEPHEALIITLLNVFSFNCLSSCFVL